MNDYILINNYHPVSMQWEQSYKDDLLGYFGILIDDINQLSDLNKKNIAAVTAEWKKTYYPEIVEKVEDHLVNISEFINDKLDSDINSNLIPYINSSLTMLDEPIQNIQTKFLQLGKLEKNYDYSQEMSDERVNELKNSIEKSIELFAVMSSIQNFKQLFFDKAEQDGYKEYLWITQRDAKVRPTHAAMDGKWVRLDDPSPYPAGYHVGMDWNCRCYIGGFR